MALARERGHVDAGPDPPADIAGDERGLVEATGAEPPPVRGHRHQEVHPAGERRHALGKQPTEQPPCGEVSPVLEATHEFPRRAGVGGGMDHRIHRVAAAAAGTERASVARPRDSAAGADRGFRQWKIAPAWSAQLTIKNKLTNYKVTFHDPCSLGRYNGGFTAPRKLLELLGVEFHEMPRNCENSCCCGAGGGQIWMGKVALGERPAENRIKEALTTFNPNASDKKQLFIVTCPKDMIMYSDAVKTTE